MSFDPITLRGGVIGLIVLPLSIIAFSRAYFMFLHSFADVRHGAVSTETGAFSWGESRLMGDEVFKVGEHGFAAARERVRSFRPGDMLTVRYLTASRFVLSIEKARP